MKQLQLIGVGAGDPRQLTGEAIEAIQRTDVFFVVDKGPAAADLAAWREGILRTHRPARDYLTVRIEDPPRDRRPQNYRDAVEHWHSARAAAYEQAFAEVPADAIGAFLVWGDPSLYDSTIRVVEQVIERGRTRFAWTVIPGVSSIQVLAAAHRTVLHGVGEPFVVTTGRRLADHGWPGRPGEFYNVVVLLDADLVCAQLDADEFRIYWGANLGTDGSTTAAGPLRDALPEIRRRRAGVKQRHGWVLDIYLLRRTS